MRNANRMAVLLAALVLSGCATTTTPNPRDPFEGFNRTMFNFNDKVDQVALKPAARVYRAVLPTFVQIGVGNFFSNLGDVWTGVNNILQGKVGDGASDFMRFAVNSTLGLAGVIDLSSAAGMPKHREDFGQTLGKWGVSSGPYVVLPLLGSSTLRDTAALPVDFNGDLWGYYDTVSTRRIGTALRLLDSRAAVLDASDLLEGAALDRYEFVRDAYLQRRESRVYDGDIPASKDSSSSRIKDPEGYVPAGPTPEPVLEKTAPAAPAAPAVPVPPAAPTSPATPRESGQEATPVPKTSSNESVRDPLAYASGAATGGAGTEGTIGARKVEPITTLGFGDGEPMHLKLVGIESFTVSSIPGISPTR